MPEFTLAAYHQAMLDLEWAWQVTLRSGGDTGITRQYVCFRCCDGNLLQHPKLSDWVQCESCGARYPKAELAEIDLRVRLRAGQRAMEKQAQQDRSDVMAMLAEDARRRAPGGSADGMATVAAWWSDRHCPTWDQERHVSTKVTKESNKTEVVQLRGIRTTQKEADAAMHELLNEASKDSK